MKEEPPNKLAKIILIVLAILYWWWWVGITKASEKPLEVNLSDHRLFLEANIPYYYLVDIGYRVVTAYNPVPEQTDNTPCITSSGMEICETKRRIIATNEFPFGTRLKINGLIWEVQDRTNSRYKNRIDLLMYDYQEAKEWGRQTVKIELVI